MKQLSLLARLAQSRAVRGATLAGAGLTTLSARAAGTAIDVSAVTDALTAAGAAIATVGLAYLAMSVGAKVFKWVKTAF